MFILDTCAFLTQKHPKGECITIPEIKNEVVNKQSQQYFENMLSTNLKIMEPRQDSYQVVEKHAKKTGDFGVLSKNDMNIIALAYEMKGTIVTDDFAMQNVALSLEVKFVSCSNKVITEKRLWSYKCNACKYIDKKKLKDCPICGNTEIFRIKSR